MAQTRNTKHRVFAVTINNWTDVDLSIFGRLSQLSYLSQYIAVEEVGEQGTRHLQCALRFKNQIRFNALKALVPDSWHIEGAKKPWDANVSYCLKSDNNIHTNIPKLMKPHDPLSRVDLYK